MRHLLLAKADISVNENINEAKELGIEVAEVERKRKRMKWMQIRQLIAKVIQ